MNRSPPVGGVHVVRRRSSLVFLRSRQNLGVSATLKYVQTRPALAALVHRDRGVVDDLGDTWLRRLCLDVQPIARTFVSRRPPAVRERVLSIAS
jgi:hypothetical protein